MKVILIYRPDVDTKSSPFSGIEVIAAAADDADLNPLIDRLQKQHPGAHFHIDDLPTDDRHPVPLFKALREDFKKIGPNEVTEQE